VEKIRAIQQHIPDIDANSKAFALKPFEKLAVQDVEALRYRAEDVARSIGRAAVRDARIREIRSELLNSDRLAAHFEENPDELSLLKHDFGLTKHGGALHLNHLPSYLRGGGAGERNVEKDLGPAHQSDNILGKQQVLKFFEPKKNDVAGKKSATGKRKTSQM
jgi:ATP-dependent RNA helicase DDX56/DBP9